ncbi:ABC1 kinase family protein [Hydrogenophaga intermedia]|uniref:ABC1 kinase family protein n=1 Tax=Hydrogenophaga intermedia TaxID=65786 RepID=UPI002043EF04|nr:AarF/UbiB family protein [Hydrogenophaga intermedia]MCM3562827.1 AarF/UbiB family protein [Hydrogenophaga intermedia]
MLNERERLAQILVLFGRHGVKGLAGLLGIGQGREEPLENARPEAVVALMRDLGPVAVKFGQLLAMRSDLLEPEWTAALSTLQDRLPPLPFESLRPIVEEAVGAPLGSAFLAFDEVALAAASIAQVHAATLTDGREVIVKIRRPGIERQVDADLRILRRLARMAQRRLPTLARLRPDELLRHLGENLAREMDLGAEARSSESIGAFLATIGVRTAGFEWELTGRRVNIQQRLRGVPASDLEAARRADVPLPAMAHSYAQAVLRMIVINGEFHADPHPGNVYFLEEGSLAFIDFGSVGTLRPQRREELVRLGLAVAINDTASVVDVLMAWAGDPAVDRRGLEHDIVEIIGPLRDVPLGQIDLVEVFRRVFTLLRHHHLALPPDLALVLRTLLTAESFVRRMDPAFHIASELGPLAAELMRERASPQRLKAEGVRLLGALGRAALSTPGLVGQLERFARTGTVPVSLPSNDLERLRSGRHGRRDADPNVLPAALAVSAAILYSSEPRLAAVAAAAGFVLVVVNWLRRR